jgi:hypothetical protein
MADMAMEQTADWKKTLNLKIFGIFCRSLAENRQSPTPALRKNARNTNENRRKGTKAWPNWKKL